MNSRTLRKAQRAMAKRARSIRQDRTERNKAREATIMLGDLIRATRHLERTGRVQG